MPPPDDRAVVMAVVMENPHPPIEIQIQIGGRHRPPRRHTSYVRALMPT